MKLKCLLLALMAMLCLDVNAQNDPTNDDWSTTGTTTSITNGSAHILNTGLNINPELRIFSDDGLGTSSLSLRDLTANQMRLEKYTASGASLIDINPYALDGTSAATFRFFRLTNTSGPVFFEIFKGNGTAAVQSRLSANGNSFFHLNSGNVGIGMAAPTTKLEVAGVITATGGTSTDWNSAFSWGDHSLAGYLTSFSELDPEVGTNSLNQVPRWDGSSLVTGTITDVGGNIGIGITSPAAKLHVTEDIIVNGMTLGRGSGNSSLNTAMGLRSLDSNSTGVYNTAFGYESLENSVSGSWNTAFGSRSLNANKGIRNTGIGSFALSTNSSGDSNTALGNAAMLDNTSGSGNIAIGSFSLENNLDGSSNVAVGNYSMANSTSGSSNTSIGYLTMRLKSGGFNNTAVGGSALYNNGSGSENTVLGYNAGYNNAGSSNVFIGYQSGFNEAGSDKLYIENTTSDTPLIYGDFVTDDVVVNGSFSVTEAFNDSAGNSSTVAGQILKSSASGKVYWTTESDGDPTNELQTLSILGSDISLSNGGGTVSVPSSADNLGNHIATTTLDLDDNWLTIMPDITTDAGNMGISWHGTGTSYGIYKEAGAWTSPYPDLMIRYHAGLKLSAEHAYGGVRIYANTGEAHTATFDNNGLTLTGLTGVGNRMVVANASGTLSTQAIPTGDDLGNHTATTTLNMSNRDINGVKDLYMNNWARWSDNDGLYWSSNLWHIYPTGSTDMILRSGSSTSGGIRMQNGASTRGYLAWDANWQGFTNSARQYQLKTRNNDGYSPSLYFDEEGNETWTGDPVADEGKIEYHSNRFYIAAGNNSTEVVRFRRGSSDVALVDNIGYVRAPRFVDWNNTGFYVDPAGSSIMSSVGLGGVLPGATLHIEQDGTAISDAIRISDAVTAGQDWYFYATTNDDFRIRDDGSDVMTFQNGTDYVGINTTAPTANLSVSGTANKTGGGSWATFSDKRIKKDIQPYEDGLDVLMKIEPVKYRFVDGFGLEKDPDKEFVGVIAQEIMQHAPYMVNLVNYKGETPVDYDPDNEDTHTENQGSASANTQEKELYMYDPSALDYILINSVQEQQQEIEEVNDKVSNLQNNDDRITALEEENIKQTVLIEGLLAALQKKDQEFDALIQQMTQFDIDLQQCCLQHQTGSTHGNGSSSGTSLDDKPHLAQNVPNPFSEKTIIRYYIPNSGKGKVEGGMIRVMDLKGIVLWRYDLVDSGYGQIEIDANTFAPATYIYELIVGDKKIDSKKMIIE